MPVIGKWSIVKTTYETISPDLIAIVQESNVVCTVCHREFEKGETVAVYDQLETIQVAHTRHFEVQVTED
jgi:hypothetical protein